MNIPTVQANEKGSKIPVADTGTDMTAVSIKDIKYMADAICRVRTLVGIASGSGFIAADGIPLNTTVPPCPADELLIIPDLSNDNSFTADPAIIAAGAQSYIALPLQTGADSVSGTLCIWCTARFEPTAEQVKALSSLANTVAHQVSQAQTIAAATQKLTDLAKAYAELDTFATIAAHDLKSPLNAMISLTHLLQINYGTQLDEEGNEYINFLGVAANNLTELVSGVLNYSRSTQVITEQKEDLNFTDLVEEVTGLIHIPDNISIRYEKNEDRIHTSHVAIIQILLNLIDNAIIHNDKSQINVSVSLAQDNRVYIVRVQDNGPGIAPHEHDRLFDLFKKPKKKGDKKAAEMSIGLAIVKKLADKLGGTVKIESDTASGTTVTVSLPK